MRRTRHLCSFVFIFCVAMALSGKVVAQKENVFLHPQKFYKKFFPDLKIKRDKLDTSYIRSYPNYLSVEAHVLSPSIRVNLIPKMSDGHYAATAAYRTNIADIIGFSASYRFVSAGFAFLLKSGMQTHDDYAKSQYRTATIKYSSKAWSLQFKYLRFKGLTDVNSTTGSDAAKHYVKREDIVNKEFQFEGIYNPRWRKYSYTAPFTFTQRQLKSSGGFLFKTGFYYRQLKGDSALVQLNTSPSAGATNNPSVIRSLSIKLAPGVGGNFVFFNHYYVSAAFFPSYDLFFYKYLNDVGDKVKGRQSFVFVLDGKASLGYQSKRIYGGIRYEFERNSSPLHNLKLQSTYTYIGLELGYRFNTPHVVKKVYKETMPPGM